jgi:hypothetical protein
MQYVHEIQKRFILQGQNQKRAHATPIKVEN